MTPTWIAAILRSPITSFLARLALTFAFWSSGIAKALDPAGAAAEMSHFGLEPAAAYAWATVAVQLIGSLLIIVGRGAWLGAGMLVVFTLLTIPIAHAFWKLQGEQAMTEFFFVVEHISVIGGLACAAILCEVRRQRSAA